MRKIQNIVHGIHIYVRKILNLVHGIHGLVQRIPILVHEIQILVHRILKLVRRIHILFVKIKKQFIFVAMFELYITQLIEKLGRKPTAAFLSNLNINYRTAQTLVSGKAKSIKLDNLFKMCEILQCTPNDLLTISPKTAQELPPNHPLLGLIKKSFNESALDMLRTFTPTDLDNVAQLIKEYKEAKPE